MRTYRTVGKLSYDAVLDGLVRVLFPRPELDEYLEATRTEREDATREARQRLTGKPLASRPPLAAGGGTGGYGGGPPAKRFRAEPSAGAGSLDMLVAAAAAAAADRSPAAKQPAQPREGPSWAKAAANRELLAAAMRGGSAGPPPAGPRIIQPPPLAAAAAPKQQQDLVAAASGRASVPPPPPPLPTGPPKVMLALFPWEPPAGDTQGVAQAADAAGSSGAGGQTSQSPPPQRHRGSALVLPGIDKPYIIVDASQTVDVLRAWVNGRLLRKGRSPLELLCRGQALDGSQTLERVLRDVWQPGAPRSPSEPDPEPEVMTILYKRGAVGGAVSAAAAPGTSAADAAMLPPSPAAAAAAAGGALAAALGSATANAPVNK